MDYKISFRQKDGGIQAIVNYKDHTGKWRQKSKQGFTKQRDAKRYADKMLEDLKENFELTKDMTIEYEGITFKDFFMVYVKQKEIQNELSTIKNLEYAAKKFAKLDSIKLEDIKSLHVQDCVNDMVKEGLTLSSIKTYLKNIKTLFNYAIDPHKLISENPVRKILIPEDKQDEKIKALTISELNELLSKINNEKFYIATLIASKCGLRASEILGLTWDCVDFKNSLITVNKQWKEISRGQHGFGAVKKKNSNRDVPMPPHVIKELKKYKKRGITDLNNRVVIYSSTDNFSRVASNHYERAGFNITLHDLRHTYATMLVANGVDFKTVAKFLGHDIEMTLKVYSHVTDDMINKATGIVNQIFK